ncbi:MAG: diguanylate cyclase, partial [Pseudomonadota bacterium]
RALSRSPRDAAVLADLRSWAGSLRAYGMSSVAANVGGERWQLDGRPAQAKLQVPLRGAHRGWLLWSNGYVLRRTLPVRDAGGLVGLLTTEQSLDLLTGMNSAVGGLGETGEIAVCSGNAIRIHCFPMRNRPLPFSNDRVVSGQPLPMDFALRGRTGSTTALDYRRQRVLAAYGPVGDTGLGLVVKRDIADLYAPVRQQFQRIVIFLFGLLLLGMWILRRRLRPLLRALEESRTHARASSARFEAAVESNLDAFFILEPMRDAAGDIEDLRYVLLNARAERMLGRPRAQIIGHGMCELFPERRSDGTLARYVLAFQTGEPVKEERSAIADTGQTRWYHLQGVKFGNSLGVTVRDITRAREAVEQARHLAIHDPLTGLANRRGFALALEAAIAEAGTRGHVVAVALLDLDEFKPINDSLGHAAGDQVLQHVASRLREAVRPTDSVARLGGDEFALVLTALANPGAAEIVARKVIAQVARPMHVEGHGLKVTASMGISVYPLDGSDAMLLLAAADAAMYRAKRAGRNQYAMHTNEPAPHDPGAR